MVKNRKPLFVSEAARNELKRRSREQRRFMGDVVDILLGIKTEVDLEKEYEENHLQVKHIRKHENQR